MSVFALLFGSRPKVLQTVTFNTNGTWVCPADVPQLNSLSGHGVAGTPDTTYPTTLLVLQEYSYFSYDDGASFDPPTLQSQTITTPDAPIPADFCYSRDPYTGGGHYNRALCFAYGKKTVAGLDGGSPATTGASATAFGKTFPGGAGGAAATVTYPNTSSPNPIPTTGGTSYPISCPPGATVQITFYQ